MEEWGGGGERGVDSWTLSHFLAWTSSVIRKDGWTSAKEAYESDFKEATKSRVLYFLIPPMVELKAWEREREEYRPQERDEKRADKAIDWVRELPQEETDGNDYLYNLNLVGRAGFVTPKTAGLAASMIKAHAKAEERELERRKQAEWVNEHLGEVGRRQEFTVTCDRIHETEGHYGTTGIHKLRDPDGRALTWFASGSANWLEEGCWYVIKATVKKHDEYKGRKQTTVTRVNIVKELDE
jgi:hypothetical protein